MDLTLLIAGGYWGVSKKLHKQVDPDNSSEDRGVDYAIRLKGIPEEFFPTEKKKIVKYFCTTCEKPVPEWEVENKIGCFQHHKCRQDISFEDVYPTYLYRPVQEPLKKKKKFLADALVLMISNSQGLTILEKLFHYIDKCLPTGELMPQPVAVGTKNGWLIESADDIPLCDVTTKEVKVEDAQSRDKQLCPHCDKEINIGFPALRMHVLQTHKKIFEEKYRGKNKEEIKSAQEALNASA